MCTWSGGVFIEYLMNFLSAYRRQGESVLQQDQRKNVSSLTLMSKGEKRSLLEVGVELSRSRAASGAESSPVQKAFGCMCCHQCQRGRLLANI
jgi:hypothetical protein